MLRAFKYRLRMNSRFQESCERTLSCCRELYNAALSQRIAAHRLGKSVGLLEQSRQLTEARELPELANILCSFQQNALRRLDRAYKAFFRRVKTKKERAGFPRFKSRERYDSFNTRDSEAFRLEGDKLVVGKLGSCRVRLSRPLEGRPRAITIRREWDGWYAIIVCDQIAPRQLPEMNTAIGIDVGLESFATLSDGSVIENPRYFRQGEAMLAVVQQSFARKTKGSLSHQRAKRLVAKTHAKVRRQRGWFHWQQARSLVSRFDLIAVEKLNVKGMAQSNLAKSIHDAGWAGFVQKLSCKAEEAGRLLVRVNAKFTSQECSGCGNRQKLELSDRQYDCPHCGLSLGRDHNAAINILGRAVPEFKIEPVRT